MALLGSLFFSINFQMSFSKSVKKYSYISIGMALNLKVRELPFYAVITSSHPWSWSALFDWIFFFPLVAFVCFLYLDLATFLVKIINFSFLFMLLILFLLPL